jgi:hypothetical protein
MRRKSAIWICAAIVVAGCSGGAAPRDADRTAAINEARVEYAVAKQKGIDFADGPCIAEHLPGLPDWVADVAHDPRQPVDDQPQNQCARARSGDASHFVELDPDGNLIRTR